MDYATTMRTVAELIQHRDLDRARALLGSLLREYPGDRRAEAIAERLDAALAGRPAASQPAPADGHSSQLRRAMRQVRQSVSQLTSTPWRDIPVDTPLEELGLDEVDLVELSVELEDAFGVLFDWDGDDVLAALQSMTVRELADLLLNTSGAAD